MHMILFWYSLLSFDFRGPRSKIFLGPSFNIIIKLLDISLNLFITTIPISKWCIFFLFHESQELWNGSCFLFSNMGLYHFQWIVELFLFSMFLLKTKKIILKCPDRYWNGNIYTNGNFNVAINFFRTRIVS